MNKYKYGFTLIELLVVMSILAILSAIMFGSQYSVREQSYLFQDQYKIVDILNKAKNLTLAAFMREADTCGYGVSFENKSGVSSVILYRDKRSTAVDEKGNIMESCGEGHSHEYNLGKDVSIDADSFTLSKTNRFFSPSDGQSIAVGFNAPSLNAYLVQNENDTTDAVKIILETIQTKKTTQIVINQFGQVSTQ